MNPKNLRRRACAKTSLHWTRDPVPQHPDVVALAWVCCRADYGPWCSGRNAGKSRQGPLIAGLSGTAHYYFVFSKIDHFIVQLSQVGCSPCRSYDSSFGMASNIADDCGTGWLILWRPLPSCAIRTGTGIVLASSVWRRRTQIHGSESVHRPGGPGPANLNKCDQTFKPLSSSCRPHARIARVH